MYFEANFLVGVDVMHMVPDRMSHTLTLCHSNTCDVQSGICHLQGHSINGVRFT